MKKERADILLVKKRLAESREEAKKIILAGKLRIGKDHLVKKTSELLDPDLELTVELKKEFVSRGAYKLLPAITEFPPLKIPFIAADIGASTGGFT
ncbi:MAG TPA: S4 domain-containing protein, partial [Victivallales bacterium]|nr:S4 domain-containing protein [Victivallales bacterium]